SLASLPGELHALAGGQVGHVRVGFTGLAMATVLPKILREFHRSHPGIKLELTESPTSAQLTALQAGNIACGFFHPDAPTPGARRISDGGPCCAHVRVRVELRIRWLACEWPDCRWPAR